MVALIFLFLNLVASPFNSKSRLEAEQAIAARELDATAHLALQYNQLLPQCGSSTARQRPTATGTTSTRIR
jgi:hypothetical protein